MHYLENKRGKRVAKKGEPSNLFIYCMKPHRQIVKATVAR